MVQDLLYELAGSMNPLCLTEGELASGSLRVALGDRFYLEFPDTPNRKSNGLHSKYLENPKP